jgi:hypothetical protein
VHRCGAYRGQNARPTEISGVIAAAQRYFAGEKVDCSDVRLEAARDVAPSNSRKLVDESSRELVSL